MANLLNQNPWIIDTPGTSVLQNGIFRPRALRWIGAVAPGHKCKITDQNDVIVWESTANVANYAEESRIESDWNGFKVPVLDSGKLYIEHL